MSKLQVLLFFAAALFCISADAEELQIAGGKIRGQLVKSVAGIEVRAFLGIRYATAKRYEKAVPSGSWSGVQDATEFGHVCYHFGLIASLQPQKQNESDDCLFVNVWTPKNASATGAKKPVMVFIHGGAFEGGSGAMDGQDLAALGDVIFLTMNYRLSMFGWMMGGDLTPNLGLHDQLLALKWVNQNIHFFGGDPNQVTLFGESAGSMSVNAHILNPEASKLFKRAIMQSGSLTVETLCNSKERALEKTAILGAKVNCTQKDQQQLVDCIKRTDVEQLKTAAGDDFVTDAFFVPTWGVDELLPMEPSKALRAGHFKKDLDLIYGTNRDEGSIFALFILPEIIGNNHLTKEALIGYVQKILKTFRVSHAQEVIDYYAGKVTPNSTQDDYKSLINAAFGDYALVCPTVLAAQEMARHASPSARFYSYRLMEYKPEMGTLGVAHSADLQFLFSLATTKHDADMYQLGQDMIHAWAQFAHTGVPGRLGGVEWAEAVGGNKAVRDYRTRYLHLETGHYKMVDHFFEGICDGFWKPKLFT